MRLELVAARKLGLEVWLVRLDGRTVGSFLSERLARTRYMVERSRLGL